MPAKIIDFTAPHKRKTESEIRISEVEKMALDKKMSYGQYVAMLEEEKKKRLYAALTIIEWCDTVSHLYESKSNLRQCNSAGSQRSEHKLVL